MSKIKTHLLFVCLTVFLLQFPLLSTAQKKKSADKQPSLETLIDASFNTFKPTGVAVAVVKDGQIVFKKGYGTRNVTTNEPVESASLFNIASCSKAFTAASIGLLVEEGKLRWDDKVIDHIAGFQLADPWITSQLTIRDLLCHRSGLFTFEGDLLWYGTDYTDEQILAHLRYLPIRTEFRSEFGYQNNLYMVAGLIIQKVSGKTWSQFVTDRFFKPLEMNNTTPSNDELAANANLARGHIEGKLFPMYDFNGCKPAASIHSSVEDLANWVTMLMDGGKWKGTQVLDPKTIRAVMSGQTILPVSPVWESWGVHFRTYGLGWSMFDYAGRKVVEHNGGMPGYISKVMLMPEEKLAVIVLNNGMDGVINDAIRFKVMDHFLQHKGQDWDQVFKGFADQGAANQKTENEFRAGARVMGTQPSLGLEAYTGVFTDKTYGDAKVEILEGKLFLTLLPSKNFLSGALEHFHYNTFKVQFKDFSLPFGLIGFEVGPDAKVTSFKIDLPNGDFHFYNLNFKRK